MSTLYTYFSTLTLTGLNWGNPLSTLGVFGIPWRPISWQKAQSTLYTYFSTLILTGLLRGNHLSTLEVFRIPGLLIPWQQAQLVRVELVYLFYDTDSNWLKLGEFPVDTGGFRDAWDSNIMTESAFSPCRPCIPIYSDLSNCLVSWSSGTAVEVHAEGPVSIPIASKDEDILYGSYWHAKVGCPPNKKQFI